MSAAAAYEKSNDVSGQSCGRLFDNVTYWPNTRAGQLAVVVCPSHFRGLELAGGQHSAQHVDGALLSTFFSLCTKIMRTPT